MTNNYLIEIERKLNIFYNSKTKTFIKVKFDSSFSVHNGFIKEVQKDYIIFEDYKKGLLTIDIKDILKVDNSKINLGTPPNES